MCMLVNFEILTHLQSPHLSNQFLANRILIYTVIQLLCCVERKCIALSQIRPAEPHRTIKLLNPIIYWQIMPMNYSVHNVYRSLCAPKSNVFSSIKRISLLHVTYENKERFPFMKNLRLNWTTSAPSDGVRWVAVTFSNYYSASTAVGGLQTTFSIVLLLDDTWYNAIERNRIYFTRYIW